MQRIIALAAIVLMATLVGCGKKGPDVHKVTGKVTLDGKPLEGARVVLHLDREGGANLARNPAGTSDAEGNVNIEYPLNDKMVEGAPLGKYKITVSKYKSEQGSSEMTAEESAKQYMKMMEGMKKTSGTKGGEDLTAGQSLVPPKYGNPDMTPFNVTVSEGDGNTFEAALKSK